MSCAKGCNLLIEDFSFAQYGLPCPTCKALGLTILCGSHPRSFNAPLVVPQQLASPRSQSKAYGDRVCVLGTRKNILSDGPVIVELLGTCFPITPRHVITCHHNLYDEITQAVIETDLLVDSTALKRSQDIVFPNAMQVRLVLFDLALDWAILELIPMNHAFIPFPLASEDSLPNPASELYEVKAVYAPIGHFLISPINKLTMQTEDYRRVHQYDFHAMARDEEIRIVARGGLPSGSCGAPYLNHYGQVVAMHDTSLHEGGKNISLTKLSAKKKKEVMDAKIQKKRKRALADVHEKVEDTREAIDKMQVEASDSQSFPTDFATLNASVKIGLVLARVQKIVSFIHEHSKEVEIK